MKKVTNLILTVLAASLILVTGCYDNAMEGEPVPEYDGTVALGWTAFEAGDFGSAMEYFLDAIDMDVTQPDAFLGAGWTSILLPEYWVLGDQYDYMAMQLDGGTWPVTSTAGTVEQDLSWTVFQCIDPVLTASDWTVINAYGTTDTLIVDSVVVFEPDSTKLSMDNQEIGQWLYDQYGNDPFKYTFEIADPNVVTAFEFTNNFSQVSCKVDSIVNNANSSTVYLNVPYFNVETEGPRIRTWCMNTNIMAYEYASYMPAQGQTTDTNDALAAYGILQHARGINGVALSGVATLMGIADEAEYTFGHWNGLSSLKLKGMAAALAYTNSEFRFAFRICRTEGYAMGIEVDDDNFVIELGQQIELMLAE